MERRDWWVYPWQVDAKVAEWQRRFPQLLRVDAQERKIGLSLRAESGREGEEGGPRLVIRSDEIAAAENGQQLIRDALQKAPQRQEAAQPQQQAPGGERGASLNIPHHVAREAKEQTDQDPTESDVAQEGSDDAQSDVAQEGSDDADDA